MILLKIDMLKHLFKIIHRLTARLSNQGAISVEYALRMVLAAILMMGVERLFRNMAIDVLNLFIDMVSQFPNI
jgi:hypothetical protein